MKALNIIKVVVQVVSIGATVAMGIIANKELDAKIAEHVSKALENK